MTDEECGSCRFWRRHLTDEVGDCRRHRPIIIESLVAANMSPEGDIERDDLELATKFPVTFIDQWCGEHELGDAVRFARIADASAKDSLARLDADYARALAPPPVDDDTPW